MPWKTKEAQSEYNKKYREAHKQELAQYNQKWKNENRDHFNENMREWRKKNLLEIREKERIKAARWRKENNARHKENIRNRKLRTIKALWEYKEARGCSECSEKDPRCLDFHHRNPEEKSYHISLGLSNKLSLETLMKEIAKCDLLCRNCHIKLLN